MIKFTATTEKGLLIGLGLSFKNLKKLKKNQPIVIDMTELGLGAGTIMIFAGEDEKKMERELQQYIGPDTKVNVDPRVKL